MTTTTNVISKPTTIEERSQHMRIAITEDYLGDMTGFTDDERRAAVEAARRIAEQMLRERGFDVEVVVDDDLARRQDAQRQGIDYDPYAYDPDNDPVDALTDLWQQIIDRVAAS